MLTTLINDQAIMNKMATLTEPEQLVPVLRHHSTSIGAITTTVLVLITLCCICGCCCKRSIDRFISAFCCCSCEPAAIRTGEALNININARDNPLPAINNMIPVAASSPNTHPLPTTKKNYGVDRSRSSSSSTSSDERDHNMRMVNRNAQPQQIFSMDAESANDSAFSANDTAFSEVYGMND